MELVQSSWKCTSPSIQFEIHDFVAHELGVVDLNDFILGINFAIAPLTLTCLCLHHQLFMRLIKRGVFVQASVARTIHVGVPPDVMEQYEQKVEVVVGLPVPEADREVSAEPLAVAKRGAFAADAVDADPLVARESLTIGKLFSASIVGDLSKSNEQLPDLLPKLQSLSLIHI